MVQVINTRDHRVSGDIGYEWGAWGPIIHIHHVKRDIHGNGIAIHIYGEMRIAAKEVVYARELKLNTIQTLNLTCETRAHTGYSAQKWIHNKGEYDNWASIDIFDMDGNEQTHGVGPDEGSIWLDFEALGE